MPREDATQGFQAPATIPKGRRSFTRLKRDRYIQALMKRLSVAAPWLQDIDMPLVKSFAQLERLSAEVYQRLRDEGLFAADGTPHVGLQKFIQLRKTQATIASMLGSRQRRERQSRAMAACRLIWPTWNSPMPGSNGS